MLTTRPPPWPKQNFLLKLLMTGFMTWASGKENDPPANCKVVINVWLLIM